MDIVFSKGVLGMKKLKSLIFTAICFISCFLFNINAFAAAEEFTEEDRMIFGIFPIWAFLLIIAGVVMVTIIIIVEIFKRKNK